VSGVNIQASSQLASCEGARVIVLCDVNNADEEKQNTSNSSSNTTNFFADFKTVSRAICFYGMYTMNIYSYV